MPAPAHTVTAGEKKFDRLTYTGIGYIINALLSVGAVYWAERTHAGQKSINQFGEWFGRTFKLNPEPAKMLATKSFFLAGGFAVLLPMKWLEDAKAGLVKQWNREHYGTAADADPVIQRSEQEIAEGPKQTWSSIFASRVLALVPFYATVGLLWDRTSLLARTTNPELSAMSKEAVKDLEHTDPAAFSQLANKGFYFDRPIAAVSRNIGKIWARITGETAALEKITEMERTHPGMIKQDVVGSTNRDPIHSSLPYYFISEAITSGMVAWGVYVLTRITGPFFDKNHRPSPQARSPLVTNPQLSTVETSQAAPEHDTPHSRIHSAERIAALQEPAPPLAQLG